MQLNTKQLLGIIGVILGVLITSGTALTDIVGPGPAKTIIALAGMLNSTVSGVLMVLNSQGSTVKEVLAMPGVEKIDVNAQANKTLSTIAVDPQQDKISPTPAAMDRVTQTAKGA